jgi:acyl carrier protein
MATKEEIFEKVRDIVVEELDVSPSEVEMHTKFEDFGADSLNIVEVIMRFEDEFGTTIPDEVAETLTDIDKTVTYIFDNQKD